MANNSHVYSIDLDISSSAASKRALKELQDAFTNSDNSVRELNKSYVRIASTVKDTTQLDKEYNKVINDRIKDREKEIDKLKALQIGIVNNTKLSETQRKNLLDNTKKRMETAQQEIDMLNKSNIVRIKLDAQHIKQMAEEAKLEAEKQKALKEEEKRRRKLSTYIKADIVALKDKIKAQFQFIRALKTTEGRYNAIKKVVAGAAKLAFKVAKFAGGAAFGLAGGLMGGSIASAERTQQKADAMRSLKSGISEETLDAIYIKTGADYQTIVAAINRVASLVDKKDVAKYAIAEIKNPGLGALLAQQTKIDTEIDYASALNQIRKLTGVQDTSAIIEAATNSRAVKHEELSQFDHMQATAALSQLGLDGETIERIISSVAKNKGNKSFIDAFNSADLSKYVWDQGLKNTLSNANLKLQELDYTGDGGLKETPEQKAARETAEELRRFELEKDKMLREILPGVLPLMKALMKLVQNVMPTVLSALGSLVKGLGIVVKWVMEQLKKVPIIGDKFRDVNLGEAMISAGESMKNAADEMREANERAEREATQRNIESNIEALSSFVNNIKSNLPALPGLSGGQNAQGGLITSPSIVGEAGPELVLPLDYSRAGRANQIINNFTTTQSFNLASNQSTPLALASAVGQNKFVQRSKVF